MGGFTRAMLAVAIALSAASRADDAREEDAGEGDPREEESSAARKRDWDAIALPVLSYSSDLGFSFGLVGGANLYAPGYEPYRHAASAQVTFTNRGGQSHFVRYDGPGLLGPLRLEAQLELKRELRSPYFGSGNRSAPEFEGGPLSDQFSYERRSPRAWFRLRGRPIGRRHPFQLWGGYLLRAVTVRAYEISLLAEAPPPGIEGGLAGQFSLGALWDTRDSESNPTRGGLEELALRASARATLSDYAFAGITVSERRYLPLGPPMMVLAFRAVLDHQVGNVPFFEWPAVGGLAAPEGIGGMTSVRGVPRARFAGNTKAFANLELRWLPFSFPFRGRAVHLGGVAFADAGRVWQPGVDDGPWYAWHPGLGLGLRAVRGAVVLRADGALSPETGRGALYFTVGHMF